MSEKDKEMLDILLRDKGEKYRVVIDNDSVWVEDKAKDSDEDCEIVHHFSEFGYYLLEQVFNHLGLDASLC